MALSSDELTSLLRELALASYTSLRPGGMRAVRGADLLALVRKRLGQTVTEDELGEAIAGIGGRQVQLTTTGQMIASVLRRRKRWQKGYLIPAQIFEGLKLPSRLRTPRSPR